MNKDKNSFVIQCDLGQFLMTGFILLVLFRVPRTILRLPFLYSINYSTRSIGDRGELFGITIVEVLLIVISLLYYFVNIKKKKHFRYWMLISAVILINLFRYMFGLTNPFMYNSYEVILSIIVSFSCATIAVYYCNTTKAIERILEIVIIIAFLTQLYLAWSNHFRGSFGCLGLSPGALALCYATFIILKFVVKPERSKSDIILLCISIIGIVLSGSRTHLVLLFVFCIIYVFFVMPLDRRKWKAILLMFLLFVVLLLLQNGIYGGFLSKKINSLFNLFSTGVVSYVSEDASISERVKSWITAIKLIIENPVGISCSVVDLQNRMYSMQATTFPHSFLLTYYLLLGIPGLVLYIKWISIFFRSKGIKNLSILAGYILIALTIYGGVSTPYLLFFWLFMIYSYMKSYIADCYLCRTQID